MTNMPDTRDSLLVQLHDPANLDAWEEFTQLYRPIVYRLARSRGLQDADAEDLSQQVMLSVARSIEGWQRQPHSRFRHWLGRVARNAIINVLTRQQSARGVGGSAFLSIMNKVVHPIDDLASQIELEYQRQIYRRAAEVVRASVHEDTWKAFVQTVVEGESTEVVAARLGKTLGNVHAARSRLMRRLQSVVQDLMEADNDTLNRTLPAIGDRSLSRWRTLRVRRTETRGALGHLPRVSAAIGCYRGYGRRVEPRAHFLEG